MRKDFSPESRETRLALNQLSKALISLHKLLLDTTRDRYVAEHGPIENSFRFLDLVMNHDFFAWLRPLSQLIVRIDELAETEFSSSEVEAISRTIDEMLDIANPTGEFAPKYAEALLMHPDLVLKHADAKQAAVKLIPVV